MTFTLTKAPGSDILGRPHGYVVPAHQRQRVVTDWSGYKDFVNAPPDYATFYRQYIAWTRHLVAKFAPPLSEFDDVVSDILSRFFERDSLGVFRREWYVPRSPTRKANFRSYFSRFVVMYARGYVRNILRHRERYLTIYDEPVTGHDYIMTDLLQGDVLNQASSTPVSFIEPSHDELAFAQTLGYIREEFADDSVEALWELLMMATQSSTKLTSHNIANRTGIPRPAAKQLLKQLQDAVNRAGLHVSVGTSPPVQDSSRPATAPTIPSRPPRLSHRCLAGSEGA